MSKIISYNQANKIVKTLKKNNKTVIFRTGCFDILHYGHIKMLQKAKNMADVLIVGLGTDSTVSKLKGNDKPFFSEKIRAKTLEALSCVDFIVLLNEPLIGSIDHELFLKKVRPDFFYLPDSDPSLSLKKQMAKKFGICVKTSKDTNKNIFSSSVIAIKISSGG